MLMAEGRRCGGAPSLASRERLITQIKKMFPEDMDL
jgi:hypothetical protein